MAETNLSSDLGSEVDRALVDGVTEFGRQGKTSCSPDGFDLVTLKERTKDERENASRKTLAERPGDMMD